MRTISLYINKVINHSRHITTMLGMVEAGIGIAAVPAAELEKLIIEQYPSG